MTEEELNKLAEQPQTSSWTMRSGCTDYACDCHDKVPLLVAEIRRLRAVLQEITDLPGVQMDESGVIAQRALDGR